MEMPKKLIIEIENFDKYFSKWKWEDYVKELKQHMSDFWIEEQEIFQDIQNNLKDERIIKYMFWFENEDL